MARGGGVRDRCDHCKKWVNQHSHYLGTLEEVVSTGVDFNFAVCSVCFEKKGFDSVYWDKWVSQQQGKVHPEWRREIIEESALSKRRAGELLDQWLEDYGFGEFENLGVETVRTDYIDLSEGE